MEYNGPSPFEILQSTFGLRSYATYWAACIWRIEPRLKDLSLVPASGRAPLTGNELLDGTIVSFSNLDELDTHAGGAISGAAFPVS